MIRALFRFVALVSLLLFIAVVALWVRGLRTMDHFWLIHGDEGSELIRSAEGRLTIRHTRPNGRSRITLPRRISHWSCRVGSQLPPGKSRLHWQWRFLTFEGTPAATAAEVRSAHVAMYDAQKVRAELAVSDEEWEGSRRWYIPAPLGTATGRTLATERQRLAGRQQVTERQFQIMQARSAADSGRELLAASSYWEWTFPAWLAALGTAVAPALWVAGWQRRQRMRREGRCPGCGYDLRASGERCPECGLSVGAGAAATAPV